MKKEWNKILITIGFAVALLGLLIGCIAKESTLTFVLDATGIAAMLGACFVFSKNSVVKNVGYMLCTLVGICGIGALIGEAEAWKDVTVMLVGYVVMFVGALLYFLTKCLTFFGFVKRAEEITVGKTFADLEYYKQM